MYLVTFHFVKSNASGPRDLYCVASETGHRTLHTRTSEEIICIEEHTLLKLAYWHANSMDITFF